LTLWLLKTAVVFGEKLGERVPVEIRKEIPHGIIRPGVFVDFACSESADYLYVTMSNQWNVVLGGEVEMRQRSDSFRLTWQVRHLVLRVSYFAFTERQQRKPRYPIVVYPKFRIPPPYQEETDSPIVRVRKSYVYPSVRQLEDETLYHEAPVVDPLLESPIIPPW
jgi:hypothetical protein